MSHLVDPSFAVAPRRRGPSPGNWPAPGEGATPEAPLPAYTPSAVERDDPIFELTDPAPVTARAAARELAAEAHISESDAQDLIGAVSEVTTNAAHYGGGPVRVMGWAADHQATITISDAGSGPRAPDLSDRPLPRAVGEGGLGLWLAQQMCDQMVMGTHPAGFTVRLVATTV